MVARCRHRPPKSGCSQVLNSRADGTRPPSDDHGAAAERCVIIGTPGATLGAGVAAALSPTREEAVVIDEAVSSTWRAHVPHHALCRRLTGRRRRRRPTAFHELGDLPLAAALQLPPPNVAVPRGAPVRASPTAAYWMLGDSVSRRGVRIRRNPHPHAAFYFDSRAWTVVGVAKARQAEMRTCGAARDPKTHGGYLSTACAFTSIQAGGDIRRTPSACSLPVAEGGAAMAAMARRVLMARAAASPLHFYWRSTTAPCFDDPRNPTSGEVGDAMAAVERSLCAVPGVKKLDGYGWTAGRCAFYDDAVHHARLATAHVAADQRRVRPPAGGPGGGRARDGAPAGLHGLVLQACIRAPAERGTSS